MSRSSVTGRGHRLHVAVIGSLMVEADDWSFIENDYVSKTWLHSAVLCLVGHALFLRGKVPPNVSLFINKHMLLLLI